MLSDTQIQWLKSQRNVLKGIFEEDLNKVRDSLIEAPLDDVERLRSYARYIKDWIRLLESYDNKDSKEEHKRLI